MIPMSDESERVDRLARIALRATNVLGSAELAQRWLETPNGGLNGRRPLELLASDEETRLVEDILTRIEYGVYS